MPMFLLPSLETLESVPRSTWPASELHRVHSVLYKYLSKNTVIVLSMSIKLTVLKTKDKCDKPMLVDVKRSDACNSLSQHNYSSHVN